MLARKRTPHSKSRQGCLPCKRRHRKCDESRPSCGSCQERGEKCTWLQSRPDSIHVREFRAYTPRNIAPVVEPAEARDIEHFCTHTLGFLQGARPSVLWKHSIGFFLHSSSAFRKIIAALGSQQHLLTCQDPGDPLFTRWKERADLSYAQALRSLRQSMLARTASDKAPLVLAAVLMILLESTRDSPSDLLVHLSCGIRIVSGTRMQSRSTDECDDMVALLHGLYVSCLTYWSAPGRSTHKPDFLWEHEIWAKPPAALDSPAALSQEMGHIHVESITATNSTFRPGDSAAQKAELVSAFIRIEKRHKRVREALDRLVELGQEDDPSLYLTSAGVLLSQLTIDAVLWDGPPSERKQRLCFARVLDLVEQSLTKLNAMGHGPRSFAVVLGPLAILDVVATLSGDAPIRQRCLQLLSLCPYREVLWQSAEMKTVLARKLEKTQDVDGTSSSGSSPHFHVVPAEETTSSDQASSSLAEIHQSNYEEWGRL